MKPIEFIAQDIFDKIRSRFDNLEMGDETGAVTASPPAARFFDFDFSIEGNRLGRVSVSINEIGSLKVFYGQGILDDADSVIRNIWYDFLREMRSFAKRRMLRFDTRDITKRNLNKTDFQYLASKGTKEETMKENAMFGSSKSSYYQPVKNNKTKIIVRHTAPVQAEARGARRRNIKSIYIENSDGERYKLPFNSLSTAEAMARHVVNAGRPHDEKGQAILKLGENILQLSAFKRQVGNKHDSMNPDASQIYERACMKLESLRSQMHGLGKQNYYQEWAEGFVNAGEEVVLDQTTMEDYKTKFTINSYNEDLSKFFPLIHNIMQEAGTVDLEDYVGENIADEDISEQTETATDDFAAFEDWANSVAEGRLTPDMVADLKSLIDDKITLGTDAVSAVEALQNIGINDDTLSGALLALAKVNPEADPMPVIGAWLQKNEPDVAKELGMEDMSNGSEAEPTPEPGSVPETPALPAPTAKEASEEEAENDSCDTQEKPEKNGNVKEIAEMIKSFYDRETGKFPIGETSVITKIRKEFGESAAMMAEKLVSQLCGKQRDDQELSDISRLSGGSALERVSQRAQARKSN